MILRELSTTNFVILEEKVSEKEKKVIISEVSCLGLRFIYARLS